MYVSTGTSTIDILYFFTDKLLPSEAYQLKMYCILGTYTSQSTHLKIYIMFFSLIRDLCCYMHSSYEYNDMYFERSNFFFKMVPTKLHSNFCIEMYWLRGLQRDVGYLG